MKHLVTLAAAGLLLSVTCGAAPVAPKSKTPAGAFPAKLQQTIDKIETAYFAGDIEGVWRELTPAVTGMKTDVAAKFEEALAAKKLPPPKELLVQARLKLLIENRTAALPAPAIKERLLILEALHGHVHDPLRQVAASPLLSEDATTPKNIDEFEERFKDLGKLRGQVQMAGLCARYASELAAKLPASARGKLTDEEKDLVTNSEKDLSSVVEQAKQAMFEAILELHLKRMQYGIEALKEPKLTKEKFIAAATVRRDTRILKEILSPPAPEPAAKGKSGSGKSAASGKGKDQHGSNAPSNPHPDPATFRRKALQQPEFEKEVARLTHDAEELAGTLGERAEGFVLGLEAWLRGRYGYGPDVWGLAKSEAVLKDSRLLGIVHMPAELPKPKRALSDNRRPEGPEQSVENSFPDRRHHYVWAWEDRRLVSSEARIHPFDQGVMDQVIVEPSPGVRVHGVDTPTYKFKSVTLPRQDPRLVFRIVGFTEYAEAIDHLDDFVETASRPELDIAQEIIRSQEVFTIQSNLSRTVEQPNVLAERSQKSQDDFNRQGLEWILALARVELGAMLAGFTAHEDPFLTFAPKITRQDRERGNKGPFGAVEYGELLLDGLRTHYWSIVSTGLIENYFKTGIPENHLVPYGRRAIVGREFGRAVATYFGSGQTGQPLSGEQRKELEKYDQTFLKLYRMMVYCLTFKVGDEKSTSHYLSSRAGYGPVPMIYKRWTSTERDQTPDGIRRVLTTLDPTLAGCPCK